MSDDEAEQSTFHGVAVPNDLKSLRACKVCTLVMTYDQFYRNGRFSFIFSFSRLYRRRRRFLYEYTGCLNCKDLQIAEDRDGISKYTTPHFEGIIGLIKPKVRSSFFLSFFFRRLSLTNFPPLFISAEELDC